MTPEEKIATLELAIQAANRLMLASAFEADVAGIEQMAALQNGLLAMQMDLAPKFGRCTFDPNSCKHGYCEWPKCSSPAR